eukprot:gene8205-11101_t
MNLDPPSVVGSQYQENNNNLSVININYLDFNNTTSTVVYSIEPNHIIKNQDQLDMYEMYEVLRQLQISVDPTTSNDSQFEENADINNDKIEPIYEHDEVTEIKIGFRQNEYFNKDKNYLDLQSKLNSEESKHLSVLERRKDVLRGNFFNGDKAVWKSPKFKLYCYISSTTSDTHLERNIIINELLFSLREGYKFMQKKSLNFGDFHTALSPLKKFLFNGDKAVWKSPKFKLYCYISSTTSDTHLERNIIINELLFSLREVAKPHEIEVILVDMSYGHRMEKEEDHEIWHTISKVISLCKKESTGIFFLSLLSDKYGDTLLPKHLNKSMIDDYVERNWNEEGDKEKIKLFFEWYHVDENATPPVYALSNLRNAWDENYINFKNVVLPALVEALNGVPFDEGLYEGMLIGRSVTEWEVVSAFQHEGEKYYSRFLVNKAMWSGRQFVNGLPPSDSEDPDCNYCNVRGDSVRYQYLSELKNWLGSALRIELYDDVSSSLTVSDLNSDIDSA